MGCGQSSPLVIPELSPQHLELTGSMRDGGTRIIQNDVVDRCIETQRPEESRAIPLPEGDFIDGMLGILGDEAVMELVGTLEEGELFSDPDFPASSASLSYSDPGNEGLQDITWVRPQEMCERPQLFVDGISRSDVKQGILGDCWFLSACASVAKRPELIEKVVAPGQPLSGDGYKGLVTIKFWRFGRWVTVYIDDRLPCRNGALLYASCADKSEFWVAFVEKAYAKLHGSYESLAGGHALEAFVDLTGGLAERHEVTPDLFRKLRVAFSHGGFVTCARKGDWQTEACKDMAVNGLVQGHAYTVTDIRRVEVEDRGTVQMIRVRNPWADDIEWTGPWSDSDTRWESVDESTKENLEITNLADGEFWMEFADFQQEFQEVTIATLGPDFDLDGITDVPGQDLCFHVSLTRKCTVLCVQVVDKDGDKSLLNTDNNFQVKMVQGCWMEGENAGGCRNDLEKFSRNPQYLLTLSEPDEPDPESEEVVAPRCSVLIGLMQEHRRSERNKELRMLAIAFFIYKTDMACERLSAEYFLCVPEEGSSGVFTNSREVLGRFELDPGTYVIIPSTFYPDRSRNFMLRVFALKQFTFRELPPYHQVVGADELQENDVLNNNNNTGIL